MSININSFAGGSRESPDRRAAGRSSSPGGSPHLSLSDVPPAHNCRANAAFPSRNLAHDLRRQASGRGAAELPTASSPAFHPQDGAGAFANVRQIVVQHPFECGA